MQSALLNHVQMIYIAKLPGPYLLQTVDIKFHKLLVNMALKRILQFNLTNTFVAVKSGIHIGGTTFPLTIKLKLEEFHLQFSKGFLEF